MFFTLRLNEEYKDIFDATINIHEPMCQKEIPINIQASPKGVRGSIQFWKWESKFTFLKVTRSICFNMCVAWQTI